MYLCHFKYILNNCTNEEFETTARNKILFRLYIIK